MSKLEAAVSEIIFDINKKARSRADSALNILRNSALEVLSQDGTGRRYGKHIASAPGQPPAPDKGNLRRNWSQRKLATPGVGKGIRITVAIRSRMHYADYLEYGTRKMSRRPYHDRIKNKATPKILKLFSNL